MTPPPPPLPVPVTTCALPGTFGWQLSTVTCFVTVWKQPPAFPTVSDTLFAPSSAHVTEPGSASAYVAGSPPPPKVHAYEVAPVDAFVIVTAVPRAPSRRSS
ncbi:MAG: hypothetical protein H6745_20580 [Deltaproteobacteria bacterium]|nr:hypothetical protein [Deltaproteobacteria bacterium]